MRSESLIGSVGLKSGAITCLQILKVSLCCSAMGLLSSDSQPAALPDQHVSEGEEIVVFEVFYLHHAPWVLPPPHTLATRLGYRVAAHHCKWYSVLQGKRCYW